MSYIKTIYLKFKYKHARKKKAKELASLNELYTNNELRIQTLKNLLKEDALS